MEQLGEAAATNNNEAPFQDNPGFYACQQNRDGASSFDQGDFSIDAQLSMFLQSSEQDCCSLPDDIKWPNRVLDKYLLCKKLLITIV
jgi:hypothetical protein